MSLTLTPLVITDGLARWDGRSEQVPCDGYAILFARSIAAVLPDDLDPQLALAVLDVCGAPALTARVVSRYVEERRRSGDPTPVRVAVIGGAGKSGSLSLAAARRAGAARTVGVVPVAAERDALTAAGLAVGGGVGRRARPGGVVRGGDHGAGCAGGRDGGLRGRAGL